LKNGYKRPPIFERVRKPINTRLYNIYLNLILYKFIWYHFSFEVIMDSNYVFDKKRKNYVQLSELIREEKHDDSWGHFNGFYQKTSQIKEVFTLTRYISDKVDYSHDKILNYNINRSQQGIGKTQEIKKKIEAQANVEKKLRKKYIIFGQEYILLDEYKDVQSCVKMESFKDSCPSYPEVSPLYNKGKGIPPKWICIFKGYQNGAYEKCINYDICQYKEQQKARGQRVSIATIIHSAPSFDLNKYEEVFFEENTIGSKEIEWDQKKIKTELTKLYGAYKQMEESGERFKSNTKEYLKILKKVIEDTVTYDDLKKIYYDLIEAIEITNMDASKTSKSFTEFKKRIFSIYIDDLMNFLKYRNVVGNYHKNSGIHKIDIPWSFLIFDMMVQYPKLKFTHLSASFPVEITKKHIQMWEEITPGYRIKLNVKNSHFTPHTSIGYIHKSIKVTDDKFEDMLPQVKEEMNRIKNKNRKRSVRGQKEYKDFVLSKKKHLTFENKDDKIGTFAGSPAIYFGADHGINNFRDFHTLFVVGSNLPRQEDMKKHFYEIFAGKPEPESGGFSIRIRDNGLSYHYKDPRLQMIYKEMYEDSERDSIHRLRPLVSDFSYEHPKEIHFFGLIPSDLINHDGFTIKEVE